MDSANVQAKLFRKQLLLMRYKLLIQKVSKTYNLTGEQVKKLEEKILNVNWLT